MGGPIPWDLVAQYAAAWGFAADAAIDFSIVIRELDDAFIEWHVKESKRTSRYDSRGAPSERERRPKAEADG